MSGAALADAAGIGSIEVDHMRRKGYPAEFSVGLSASSALISPIMPPSIPAVVFASVAAVSTGALFAAAVIPADPHDARAVPSPSRSGHATSRSSQGEPLRLGGVRAMPSCGPCRRWARPSSSWAASWVGSSRPTEAAGIGALYMLVLAAGLPHGVAARHRS